ncbi:MAG: hypothetical protein LJE88_07255 [Deltaproteobacteria bacterium]|nr:hypothetical protein [Deltaproteobacteria bacterium]
MAEMILSRRTTLLHVLICFVVLSGCQSSWQIEVKNAQTGIPSPCAQIEAHIDMRDRIETLRAIAQAFDLGCYETVVTYGTQAQTDYRYKTFSVLKETSNIFLPDGTFVDYVLESYERGFLSVLLAASYYHLDNPEAAKVELRRLDHEIFTPLYNYGEDPVNLLFSAVLWEVLHEPEEARVDWNLLKEQDDLEGEIRTFARQRLVRMNGSEDISGKWTIAALGNFPDIDWDVRFVKGDSGYFSVKPRQSFQAPCASESGIRISTASWFDKIAVRHSYSYHPLLHVQSWLRLPVGVVYSITTFASGAGIAVGGCFLDAAGNGNGSLCELAIIGGVALIQQSPKVLHFMLRPDLRHWDNVPASFVFTTAPNLMDEPCFTSVPKQEQGNVTTFLRQVVEPN